MPTEPSHTLHIGFIGAGRPWRGRPRIKAGINTGAWECYRSPGHKMLKSIMFGLVILMFGALVFIAATGVSSLITGSNYFAFFLAGMGALMLVNFLIHLIAPGCRLYRFSDLLRGILLLAIGVLCIYGFGTYFWPMVIVSLGLYSVSIGIMKSLMRRESGI